MFRNLKIKLTLTNALVVAIIFTAVFSGLYMFMERGITTQTMQIMHFIATDAGSAEPPPGPKPPKRAPRFFYTLYFFAKVNNNGEIFETSPNLPFNKQEIQELINKVENLDEHEHKIEWKDDIKYTVFKAPLAKNAGTIYVFADTKPESILLKILVSALAFMGLIGLALTMFGSLFMAERALIPIKESWQRQKDFIADASHELRTPLAVMQTNLELVMDNPEETIESQIKWLENIEEENKRMTKLVNDLLLLARADSEQAPLEKSYFSLNDALDNALKPLEPMFVKKNIVFSIELESVPNFFGDEERIKQLAVILADNALKYTTEGGKVNISLKDKGTSVELTVSDTGEGIEEEHLGKIFERFYRVDKARSKQSGGTGLGLAIADWIVKEHGGTITVNSIKGEGSQFIVNLPKKK